MQRICLQCNQAFEITNSDLAFYEKISPVFHGKKELIPPPQTCPDCRHRQRWAFFNERSLYNRKCDKCPAEIVSIYTPNTPFPVYCRSCYFSENWDPLEYGRDFDFSRNAMEQFREVFLQVPRVSLFQKDSSINSEYCNIIGKAKDCYLTFTSGGRVQNLYYCEYTETDMDTCIDVTYSTTCQLCYECTSCKNCYNLHWSTDCISCSDSYFLQSCTSCMDCFGCINIQHKRYCLFNEQLTKEEYEERMKKIRAMMKTNSGLLEIKQKVSDFFFSQPRKASWMSNNEDATGNYVYNSKNVRESFDISGCENVAYSSDIYSSTDCYDLDSYGSHAELIYSGNNIGSRVYNILFSSMCWDDSSNLIYCDCCTSSNNLFLCSNLRHKSYCILNKQYSKEEYEGLVPRIIEQMRSLRSFPFDKGKVADLSPEALAKEEGRMESDSTPDPSLGQGRGEKQETEWGEFFPSNLSPHGYQETVAMEFCPLTKEEALKLGFNWNEYVVPYPKVEKIVKASQLPDSIDQVPDEIVNWAIECEVSGRPFKIIKQELQFYREHGLPLPRKHPDVRHLDRMKLRNPRKLFVRNCVKCFKAMQTTYVPERKEIVYCEECYVKEVY